MCICWLTCSLCNTMISFLLKYFPGNINVNGFMGFSSELIGTVVSGYMLNRVDSKFWLKISFIISVVGGILMLVFIAKTDYYNTEHHNFSKMQLL